MKGTKWVLVACFATLVAGANAAVYTYSPPDPDLGDLDHTKAYAWGLKPSIPLSETITSATLTFYDIYDWQVESNFLNVDLLNTPPSYGTSSTSGSPSNYVVTKTDAEAGGSYWEGAGAWGGWKRMFQWSDTDGPATHNKLVYDFTNLYVYNQAGTTLLNTIPTAGASLADLNSYFQSGGFFGVGFDPDCHYYNQKIELKLTTSPSTTSVPGPFAVVPFAFGLLAAFRRKK
jgi:hypothetical protein